MAMKKPLIDYVEVDPDIRDLVYAMNELPFVATQSSCQGHLADSSTGYDILPDEGHKFMKGGSLIFRVDHRYGKSRPFLANVKGLEEKYHFVSLHQHELTDPAVIRGVYVLDLDCSDLTQAYLIDAENDPFDILYKKRCQVPTDMGRRRLEEFGRVWPDLATVVEGYKM